MAEAFAITPPAPPGVQFGKKESEYVHRLNIAVPISPPPKPTSSAPKACLLVCKASLMKALPEKPTATFAAPTESPNVYRSAVGDVVSAHGHVSALDESDE